jgi:polysaccharide export outer membrane protein
MMKERFIFSALFPLLIMTIILHQETNLQYQEYKVGIGDILSINIYGQPDLSREVVVLHNGSISFPLIGSVQVKGKSTREIAELIKNLLEKDYLYNPHVSVTVKEFCSKKVSVLGGVKKPGIYYLKGATTLLDIIVEAGMTELVSSGRKIIVYRNSISDNGKNNNNIITIDLAELLIKGRIELNLYLKNGDNIYIPEANQFFILGEVRRPGLYNLTNNLTVLKAISIAGGLTEFANPKKVFILRNDAGEEQKLYININEILKKGIKANDFILKTEDVIVVPRRFF